MDEFDTFEIGIMAVLEQRDAARVSTLESDVIAAGAKEVKTRIYGDVLMMTVAFDNADLRRDRHGRDLLSGQIMRELRQSASVRAAFEAEGFEPVISDGLERDAGVLGDPFVDAMGLKEAVGSVARVEKLAHAKNTLGQGLAGDLSAVLSMAKKTLFSAIHASDT